VPSPLKLHTDRIKFLEALADSDDVDVTDWEAEFIESCLGRQSLSPKQIQIVDKLFWKYDQKMG